MIGVISILLFLLYNIRSNVITLPFTRYEMRRPYFIIYYNDSKSTRVPVSMNLNTYLPYSIINSNHFTLDTSRIGSDIQIPLEDNDTYFDYRSDIILSDNTTIVDNYLIYIKKDKIRWISDHGIGLGYHCRNTSFSLIHQLKKNNAINKLQYIFEPHSKDGFLHFGGIPNKTQLTSMKYKGSIAINETLPTWGFTLTSMFYNNNNFDINTSCIIHSGFYDMIYSNEIFQIMLKIYKEEIDNQICTIKKNSANGDYLNCNSPDYIKGSISFSINNNNSVIEINKKDLINGDGGSSFRNNPYKNEEINKMCMLGINFLRLFNYSLFDYDNKRIEFYSNDIKIINTIIKSTTVIMSSLIVSIIINMVNSLLLIYLNLKNKNS